MSIFEKQIPCNGWSWSLWWTPDPAIIENTPVTPLKHPHGASHARPGHPQGAAYVDKVKGLMSDPLFSGSLGGGWFEPQLTHISQNGNLPQIEMTIKHI